AKSVEEVPDLIHSEPSALGHVDDRQIVQNTGFVPALPADALSFGQQANLFVIPDCRSLQTCRASHFANGHVSHIKKSLDLKRTSSPSVATSMKTSTTPPLPLIVKIAIAMAF